MVGVSHAETQELVVHHVVNVNLFDPIIDRLYSNLDGVILSFKNDLPETVKLLSVFKGTRYIVFNNRFGNMIHGAFIPWTKPGPYTGWLVDSVSKANNIMVKIDPKTMSKVNIIFNGALLAANVTGCVSIDIPQPCMFSASVREDFARAFEEERTITKQINNLLPGSNSFRTWDNIDCQDLSWTVR